MRTLQRIHRAKSRDTRPSIWADVVNFLSASFTDDTDPHHSQSIFKTHVHRQNPVFLQHFEDEISEARLAPSKGTLWAFLLSLPFWGVIFFFLF